MCGRNTEKFEKAANLKIRRSFFLLTPDWFSQGIYTSVAMCMVENPLPTNFCPPPQMLEAKYDHYERPKIWDVFEVENVLYALTG